MDSLRNINDKLNYIFRMREDLFQSYSVKCDLTPVSSWVLYIVYYNGEVYTQNNLSEMWNYPKQTVNFTVQKLVKEGYLFLEKIPGEKRSKGIYLTEKGKELCKMLMEPLIEAELKALDKLSVEERKTLEAINLKYYDSLKKEIEALYDNPEIDFDFVNKSRQ